MIELNPFFDPAMSNEPEASAKLIIPYGVARLTERSMQHASRVEIDTTLRKPLRLGDGPYPRKAVTEETYDASAPDEASVGASRLDILRRLHLRDCDVFDKHLRRWLDLYFAFIEDHARDHSEELRALAPTPAAMFDPLLWAMAALRPLPRAHIPAAGKTFVAVDVAMWDGNQIVAVVFAGGPRSGQEPEFVCPVRRLAVDPPGDADQSETIAAQLGDSVIRYWRGLVVPPDPFGPAPFRMRAGVAPSF